MFLIVGLGNPGKQYENTRHNVGFDVIDAMADKYNITVESRKNKALCGKGVIAGRKVILAKPQTYMNLSGESVAELLHYYKLNPTDELLVIYDDISLAPGRLRVRAKGSAGGHNGLKSIKVGVGEKPKGWDLADHVLGHFSSEERAEVEDAVAKALSAAELIVQEEIDRAMNLYN